MATKRIGIVRGDGIGPEIVDEGLRFLTHVAEKTGLDFETIEYPWSADHYLETGETMPESVLGEYRDLDAILLGAIGDPRVEVGLLERAIIGVEDAFTITVPPSGSQCSDSMSQNEAARLFSSPVSTLTVWSCSPLSYGIGTASNSSFGRHAATLHFGVPGIGGRGFVAFRSRSWTTAPVFRLTKSRSPSGDGITLALLSAGRTWVCPSLLRCTTEPSTFR